MAKQKARLTIQLKKASRNVISAKVRRPPALEGTPKESEKDDSLHHDLE